MNKEEREKLERRNAELYGDSVYLIYYQTKYSIGRFVIHYAYYMTDERFKKKIEKALSSKDIITVSRMLIPAALWLDVYANKELPIRVTSSGITWEELLHGT